MSAFGVVLILSFLGTGPAGLHARVDCSAGPAWTAVIEGHWGRYPGMQVADLYKLLHQGAMGSEHAVPRAEAARDWMEGELATMGEGPPEPLVDTIAPAGDHVRIHLRAFVERGGDPDVLLSAFVGTANGDTGSEDSLRCALQTARTMAREGRLPWGEDELARYFDDREADRYPAVHHSEQFESLFRPAYRVVAGSLLDQVLRSVR